MKIIFYSTNANFFNDSTYLIKTFPTWETLWNNFCTMHPNDEFICISQSPALFLPKNISFLSTDDDTILFCKKIIKQKPDLVIALSFWQNNYDWLNIKDSLIAEELQKNNINVICPCTNTCLTCFDKYKTHQFLVKNNFNTANAFFVDHSLYFCASNKKEIKYNVYKQAVINELKKLKYPIIAKDPLSLSSYNMDVLENHTQVINYLNSKKHNSNRLFEEFISGTNFGVELYSRKIKNKNGKIKYFYNIFPPFVFSTNKYGITSPKQSVKYGPVNLCKKLQKKLNILLKKLIFSLQIEGICQIDLILRQNDWYVIEINPRLSGMTSTYFSSLDKNFYQILYENFVTNLTYKKKDFLSSINIKLPILQEKDFTLISKQKGIMHINMINNLDAKQEREKGFTEIIISAKNKLELTENLNNIKNKFPHLVEESFFNTAIKLIQEY